MNDTSYTSSNTSYTSSDFITNNISSYRITSASKNISGMKPNIIWFDEFEEDEFLTDKDVFI